AGRDARGLPGVVGRDDPDGVGPVPIVPELDLLPYPDHDDYYARARQLGIDDLVGRCISIETSRGCSWGEKCHCTFCGRNADGMAFRKKSVPRVLAEIEHLGRRHAARSFLTTDSILDHGYVRDLLPEIALLGWEIDLFFEVRASLRPEEIETLRRAGVTRIQPGIESLSTRILGLMRKGTTLLQNIQCLRACRAQGIHPVWHHLFGFPGETLADYERILDIVPSLRHLDAPQSLNSVVVQRFSPYFDQASDFGIENLRPFAGYEAIYPFAPRDVFDLAYNFDHDVRGGADPALLSLQSGTLADALRDWRLGFEHDGAELAAFRVGGRALVLDSRGRERIAWALGEPETRVLDALETPGTRATALRRLRRAGPAGGAGRPEGILLALLGPLFGPDGNRMLFALATGQVREGGYRVQSIEDVVPGDSSWTASALEGTIERLVRARLVLEDAGRYLSLPIPRRFRDMRSPSPPSVHGRAG
ncbi:MAG: RiPP maturation radical SAM protein 1, partial [Planctomycetes bacterium]|nr:RiPP maturation radical SAM protein 1 [Planctomycetota bacterium]